MDSFDVIVVGGGPAGSSAALILARSRRNVALFDTGKQRNRSAQSLNGYLTRDGIAPARFIAKAQEELQDYGVCLYNKEIVSIKKEDSGFKVWDAAGTAYSCRKILLATGLVDQIPDIPGIRELYGKSVFHCPYCDGWESRDKRLVVYGKNKGAVIMALSLKNWSSTVTLCTDGLSAEVDKSRDRIAAEGINIYTQKISRLEGQEGLLQAVYFRDGKILPCDAMFFVTGYRQQSSLAQQLGCRMARKEVWVNRFQQSSVEGLYVSGDTARDMKLSIIAAADGAKAAVAINMALLEEEGRR